VNLASSNVDIILKMEENLSKEHSKSVLNAFQLLAIGGLNNIYTMNLLPTFIIGKVMLLYELHIFLCYYSV